MPEKIGPKKPFVHFIAEHRLAKQLTQKRLAERLGCDALTVSRWETYETRVDMPILAAVAEALYGDEGDGEDILHHPDRPTANQLLKKLPDDEQQYFIKQLKNALKQA